MNRVSAINVNFTGTVDLGTQNISLYMKNLDLKYFIEAFQVNMNEVVICIGSTTLYILLIVVTVAPVVLVLEP
jgi:hypothetical protein